MRKGEGRAKELSVHQRGKEGERGNVVKPRKEKGKGKGKPRKKTRKKGSPQRKREKKKTIKASKKRLKVEGDREEDENKET